MSWKFFCCCFRQRPKPGQFFWPRSTCFKLQGSAQRVDTERRGLGVVGNDWVGVMMEDVSRDFLVQVFVWDSLEQPIEASTVFVSQRDEQ